MLFFEWWVPYLESDPMFFSQTFAVNVPLSYFRLKLFVQC
jgi:hypothetical protein